MNAVRSLFATLFAFLVGAQAASAVGGENAPTLVDDSNVAVQGYDVVAYFTAGKPIKGVERHATVHQGATYRFATAENLAAFQAEPQRYLPQYGGYCAWGVGAKDDLFPIDPNAWKIVDGKLYLNYNAKIQKRWEEDVAGHIEKADAHWPELIAE